MTEVPDTPDVSAAEAVAALDAAQADRNATWHAASPLTPTRMIALTLAYITTATFMWWGFSRGTVAGWALAFGVGAAFVGTTMFATQKNKVVRPRDDIESSFKSVMNPEFTALILLAVWPGLWLMSRDPSIQFVALVVVFEVLISIPIVLRLRRKNLAAPA